MNLYLEPIHGFSQILKKSRAIPRKLENKCFSRPSMKHMVPGPRKVVSFFSRHAANSTVPTSMCQVPVSDPLEVGVADEGSATHHDVRFPGLYHLVVGVQAFHLQVVRQQSTGDRQT